MSLWLLNLSCIIIHNVKAKYVICKAITCLEKLKGFSLFFLWPPRVWLPLKGIKFQMKYFIRYHFPVPKTCFILYHFRTLIFIMHHCPHQNAYFIWYHFHIHLTYLILIIVFHVYVSYFVYSSFSSRTLDLTFFDFSFVFFH
jgi:hypothetical protein